MITLFIIPGACSFGSIVTLELLNKPYQIGITTPEIRATNEFRKINPLGKVGALKDGNYLIYENSAILFYLIDSNQNSKISLPINTPERIEAYKWLSYFASTLHAAFSPLFNIEKYADESYKDKFKQKTLERLKDILLYVNSYLSVHKYFIGNQFTVIDAQAYGLLRWCEKFELLNDYPAIAAFINELNKRSEIQNALNIEQQKIDAVKDSEFTGYYNFGK